MRVNWGAGNSQIDEVTLYYTEGCDVKNGAIVAHVIKKDGKEVDRCEVLNGDSRAFVGVKGGWHGSGR